MGAGRGLSRRGGIGKPSIDVQRLAKAISGPGTDTRFWLSAGTVGLLDDNGEFNTSNKEAVYVDRLGAVVSVRLEPSGEVIAARYNGISCGRYGFMLIPIRPGDEVVVSIPDGDLNSPAITVVSLASNETAKVPSDWNNDRVLFDLNVPFEVRGPAIKITSTNLQLNGRVVSFSPEGI
jgi:hypothetical protein